MPCYFISHFTLLLQLMPILTQALRLANTVDRQESSPEELRLDMSLFLDCTLELFRITESVAELCAPMDDDDSRDPPVTALSTFMNAFLSILGKECNGENMVSFQLFSRTKESFFIF